MGSARADRPAAAGTAPPPRWRGPRTVVGSARWSRAPEAEGTQHALTVGAEQELHEERGDATLPRVAERGDGIARDDLLLFRDVDAGYAPRGGDDIRDVHDAGVGLAQRDLVEDGADVELLARRHERHAGFAEGVERVPARRYARRREHDDEVAARQVGQ